MAKKTALEFVDAYTSRLRIKPNLQEFDQIDMKTINATTEKGLTALHIAVKNNALMLVEKLVEKGAKLDEKDKDKYTPLTYTLFGAAQDNQVSKKIMQYLVDQGANIDEGIAKEFNKFHPTIIMLRRFTPFHVAVDALNPDNSKRQARLREIFSDILNHIVNSKEDINKPAYSNITPLHLLLSHLAYCAASESSSTLMPYVEPVIKKMLESGVDISAQNDQGFTPLMCYFQKLHDKNARISYESGNTWRQVGTLLIQLFAEQKGFNIDYQDKQGRTLLMHVVLNKNFEEDHVRMLIEKKADINLEQRDEYIRTAWDIIKYYNRDDLDDLQKLLQPIATEETPTKLKDNQSTSDFNETSVQLQYPELEKQIDAHALVPELTAASAPEDSIPYLSEPIFQKTTCETSLLKQFEMRTPFQAMAMNERDEIDMNKIITLYQAAQANQHDAESVAELIKISRLKKIDVNLRKTASHFVIDLINKQSNPHAYIELGKILKKHHQGEEASDLFEKAAELLQKREINIYSSGNQYGFYQQSSSLPSQNPNYVSNLLPKIRN